MPRTISVRPEKIVWGGLFSFIIRKFMPALWRNLHYV